MLHSTTQSFPFTYTHNEAFVGPSSCSVDLYPDGGVDKKRIATIVTMYVVSLA